CSERGRPGFSLGRPRSEPHHPRSEPRSSSSEHERSSSEHGRLSFERGRPSFEHEPPSFFLGRSCSRGFNSPPEGRFTRYEHIRAVTAALPHPAAHTSPPRRTLSPAPPMPRLALALLGAALLAAAPRAQTVIHVDADAPPG